MSHKDKRPEAAKEFFDGNLSYQGVVTSCVENYNHTRSTIQALDCSFGNRCGHDRDSLRSYQKPMFHAERPYLLQKASQALEVASCYTSPRQRKLLYIFNVLNPSGRQKRSERRESMLLVLGRVLHYTDLATFSVGVPKADGSFYYTSAEEIAKDTQMHHQRVLRALEDAKRAGYIGLSPHRVVDSLAGRYYYRIEVKARLFFDLGIKQSNIERARSYAFKRIVKAKGGFITLNNIHNLSRHLEKVRKKIARTNNSHTSSLSLSSVNNKNIQSAAQREQEERLRLETYIRLKTENPQRSLPDIYLQIYGRPLDAGNTQPPPDS